jgi:hypothetical protein
MGDDCLLTTEVIQFRPFIRPANITSESIFELLCPWNLLEVQVLPGSKMRRSRFKCVLVKRDAATWLAAKGMTYCNMCFRLDNLQAIIGRSKLFPEIRFDFNPMHCTSRQLTLPLECIFIFRTGRSKRASVGGYLFGSANLPTDHPVYKIYPLIR